MTERIWLGSGIKLEEPLRREVDGVMEKLFDILIVEYMTDPSLFLGIRSKLREPSPFEAEAAVIAGLTKLRLEIYKAGLSNIDEADIDIGSNFDTSIMPVLVDVLSAGSDFVDDDEAMERCRPSKISHLTLVEKTEEVEGKRVARYCLRGRSFINPDVLNELALLGASEQIE